MVNENPMTCEQVDQNELDRRYVLGRLSETEAAAFEEHYFGCDRCWQLVKGGVGVRAGLAPGLATPVVHSHARWTPWAIAAGLGIVALGTWQIVVSRRAVPGEGMRGTGDSMVVRTRFAAGTWRFTWSPVPEATSYRIRVSSADGQLLSTRQVNDTILDVSTDQLAPASAVVYLDVQGLDILQRPVARSPLIPLSAPADSL